jgi:hypothetical protein
MRAVSLSVLKARVPVGRKGVSRQVCRVRADQFAISKPALDPFLAASVRLRNLLSTAGDGEDEMIDSMLKEETPNTKLLSSAVFSGGLTVVSVLVCLLCREAPWGK